MRSGPLRQIHGLLAEQFLLSLFFATCSFGLLPPPSSHACSFPTADDMLRLRRFHFDRQPRPRSERCVGESIPPEFRQCHDRRFVQGLGPYRRAPKVRNRGVEQGSRNRRRVSRWGTFRYSSNTLRPLWEQNAAIGLLLTAGVPSSDDRACAGSSPSCLVLRQ